MGNGLVFREKTYVFPYISHGLYGNCWPTLLVACVFVIYGLCLPCGFVSQSFLVKGNVCTFGPESQDWFFPIMLAG